MNSFLRACAISSALSAGALAATPGADPATIKAHVEFLADDLMEGRETGARGHDIAARYVASQLARTGLTPGGDTGKFLQRMPLRSTELVPSTSEFELAGPGAMER